MSSIANPVLDREAFRDVYEISDTHDWAKELREELLNLWELCVDADERSLLKELLNDFFVLDKKKERSSCDKINNYVHEKNLNPTHTIIVSVSDVGKLDGSLVGLQLLEQKIIPVEQWENCYVSHISELEGKLSNCTSIIMFDDFIGSGNKIVKKYEWLANTVEKDDVDISSIDVYIISFSAMKFGIKNIKSKIDVNVFCANEFKKGISENNSITERYKKIKLMLKIESKLSQYHHNRVLSKYSLGYCKSESLYYWDNLSCPNNVFPIFWWPNLKNGSKHDTVFTRVK
ncbi:hypothetical protein L4D76_10265 [Photobacterium sagamiensis]|uniref:phosphoribosyltransferase-like protein n=1 Tax=Photobacterium sagamiensis TaxID=2910241 RepID=UPI003D12A53D